KPLYYRLDGRGLTLACEAKAILAAFDDAIAVDPVSLREYLELGYVAAPRSMFKGIRKLRPGTLMVYEAGRIDERRYWTPVSAVDRSRSDAEWSEVFLHTVRQAVGAQMVSDVPLGAFLSGGIDSSTIVALMAGHASTPITTHSIGGDELFGGYRRYLGGHYDRLYGALPRWLRHRVATPLLRALPSDRHSPLLNLARHLRMYADSYDEPLAERYRSYVQVFGRVAAERLLRNPAAAADDPVAAAFHEAGGADAVSTTGIVDMLTQLPDDLLLLTDKMTMATSLECRVPLLDNTVLDLSLRMPGELKIRGRELKHVMKQALAQLLPQQIMNRAKRGFGAPIGAWFRYELSGLLQHTLSREMVDKRGLLEWDAVERTIALHQSGREDYTDHLLALVNLELWSRIYLDGRSWQDVAAEVGAEVGR